jgi:hypothetical protein
MNSFYSSVNKNSIMSLVKNINLRLPLVLFPEISLSENISSIDQYKPLKLFSVDLSVLLSTLFILSIRSKSRIQDFFKLCFATLNFLLSLDVVLKIEKFKFRNEDSYFFRTVPPFLVGIIDNKVQLVKLINNFSKVFCISIEENEHYISLLFNQINKLIPYISDILFLNHNCKENPVVKLISCLSVHPSKFIRNGLF